VLFADMGKPVLAAEGIFVVRLAPAGANQFGRSQPSFSPKQAPCPASRSYSGEQRSGRPLSCSSKGQAMV
jgi:hypothetical protein